MGEREELSRALPDQDLRARIWESIMLLEAIIERSNATGYHGPAASPEAEKFETTYNVMSVDVRTLLQRFVEGQAGPVTKANCQAIINKYKHLKLFHSTSEHKLTKVNSELSEYIKQIESMP
jgi:hypothetical protein